MAVLKNNTTGEAIFLSHVITELPTSKRKTSESETSIFRIADQNPLDPKTIRLAIKIFGSDRETRYRKLTEFQSSTSTLMYVGKRTLLHCEIASMNEIVSKETQAIVLTIDLREVLKSEIEEEAVIDSAENDGEASKIVELSEQENNIGLQPLSEVSENEQAIVNEQAIEILNSFDGNINNIFNGEPEKMSLYQTIQSSAFKV